MESHLYWFILMFLSLNLSGQDCNYQSPVKGKIISSGSYGEPRTAHFHAGIDFKQKRGIPYDTIYAIESGYVSRISVQPDGYGNALYIDHPCGQTSVYAHLYEYEEEIKKVVRKEHYDRKSYTLNYYLESDQIPIKKGQAIGIMGSTGRSSGPHLHFEIRNTGSEKSTNPALYNIKPDDDIAPIIRGVVVYNLTPDGQEIESKYYSAKKGVDGIYRLPQGKVSLGSLLVGVGVHTYDMMNGAKNHNGIYAAQLKVDGVAEFRFKLDSLSFETSRYIHSHMDYSFKVANRYVTKLFKNPANPLSIYNVNEGAGNISLFADHDRHVEIKVYDIDRNRAELQFDIRRNDDLEPYEVDRSDSAVRLVPDQEKMIKGKFTSILFPEGAVAMPTFVKVESDQPKSIHLKQDIEIPLFQPIVIFQKINQLQFPKDKYVLTSLNDNNEIQRHSCQWHTDMVLRCGVSDFKDYSISADSIPPSVILLSLPSQGKKRGVLLIKDNMNPVSRADAIRYDIFLNDKWQLAQHDIKSNRIWWDMEGAPTGEKYEVKVMAQDASNNKTEKTWTFFY